MHSRYKNILAEQGVITMLTRERLTTVEQSQRGLVAIWLLELLLGLGLV